MTVNDEQFKIWFPAVIGGFFVGLIATCFWEIIRRRTLLFFSFFCPCIQREVNLEQHRDQSDIAVRERQQIENEVLTRMLTQISDTVVNISDHILLNPFVNQSQGEIIVAETSIPVPAISQAIQKIGDIEMAQIMPSITGIVGPSTAGPSNSSGTNNLPIKVLEEDYLTASTSSPNCTVKIQASSSQTRLGPLSCGSLPSLSSNLSIENQITSTTTVYTPDDTPSSVLDSIYKIFKKYTIGTVNELKSSIIIQASLSIDSRVLVEIGELAKSCIYVENKITLQIGDWGIFYYKAGKVHLHILKEGDVPVNVEARWHKKKTGITMRGLHLNGAQIKAATKQTSTTLRSTGPPTQGRGHLNEFYLPIGQQDIGESLIYAAKVVEIDGLSLVVRSKACCIDPPQGTSFFKDDLWNGLQKIPQSMMKMKLFLKFSNCQPETTQRPDLLTGKEWYHGLHENEPTCTSKSDLCMEAKHKIFLSHNGVQKNFVEQLCLDLERRHLCPFFDKRQDFLLKGEVFPNLIFQAIRQCDVGVVVLSKDFFTKSKWSMLELVDLVESKRQNKNLVIIPVFFGISQLDVQNQANQDDWLKVWCNWAKFDKKINIHEWKEALKIFGHIDSFSWHAEVGEIKLREEIVEEICKVVHPESRWNTELQLVEYWKGVLQIEMLDWNKNILDTLEHMSAFEIGISHQLRFITRVLSNDRGYWQKGLHDLNKIMQWNTNNQQLGTLLSIRGGIQFLLGEFESALQDFDLVDHLNMEGQTFVVLQRAIVKFVMAKYSEAMQDIATAATTNPNLDGVQRYQRCLANMLYHEKRNHKGLSILPVQQIQELDKYKHVQAIPDLLTGKEWYHGLHENEPTCTSKSDLCMEAKHKIFLSHNGVQKNFVEQLCLDLERRHLCPFFDKRQDFLLKGEVFPNLIFQAIRQCDVGVVVLSKDFFTKSKWSMLELVDLVESKRQNKNLVIIPVFFGISQLDVQNQANQDDWLKVWCNWAKFDKKINIHEWKEALKIFGHIDSFSWHAEVGEIKLREEIVEEICKVVHPESRWNTELQLVEYWKGHDLLTGENWYHGFHKTEPMCTNISPLEDNVSYRNSLTSFGKMTELSREFKNNVNLEIECSKVHWTAQFDLLDLTEYKPDNKWMSKCELYKNLKRQCKWHPFLSCVEFDLRNMGRKIGEGGQAEVFEATKLLAGSCKLELVLKVFKNNLSLQSSHQGLQSLQSVSLDENSPAICRAFGAYLLKDGKLGILFPRFWGDLRKLIDLHVLRNMNSAPPFDFGTTVNMMLQIANGMLILHKYNIVHRDLKASNVLITTNCVLRSDFQCKVADFECTIGNMGTSFWRAPEILHSLKNHTLKPNLFTHQADVYSFSMTCYEILTGSIPFEDLPHNMYDVVLLGHRPPLPFTLNSTLKRLIQSCWHPDPRQRPSFLHICEELRRIKISTNYQS